MARETGGNLQSFYLPGGVNRRASSFTEINPISVFGFSPRPPEQFVNSSAWGVLRYNPDSTTALEWLLLNATNYPASPNVFASLAEAYELKGHTRLAVEYLERALKEWPGNSDYTARLRKLKQAAAPWQAR